MAIEAEALRAQPSGSTALPHALLLLYTQPAWLLGEPARVS